MGGGNSWWDVAKGAPQAIASGFNRGVLDLAGIPMDTATNVANLGKAAIGFGYGEMTGKAPPSWLYPSNPADVPGTSAWLNKEGARPLRGSLVNVTGDHQSYTLQALHAAYEQAGPAALQAEETMRAPVTIEGEPTSSEMTSNPQSLSAAAATRTPQSPELRQAVTAARENGEQINSDVLDRHMQAESLPVPARLTKGQATQDPVLISQEQNQRGLSSGTFAQHFNKQNQNLIDNLQAIRDEVGPDVHSTNRAEHADTIIAAYQKKDQAARDAIDAAYEQARRAIPANAPVLDARDLIRRINATLNDKWATESAPPDVMKRLQTITKAAPNGRRIRLIADGPGTMTAAQFEGLRSRLGELSTSGDGNSRYAAHLIRGTLEDSSFLPGAEAFKAPFDQARALARQRFQTIESDPAYSAAVNGTVAPDVFVHRFIVNGNRDDIATMRRNLADDPVAQQTVSVAALDHLRRSAKIDDDFRGNFAAASFNNAWQGLAPKARILFPPKQVEDLSNLRDVSRYETFQPRGSYVNNSNTAVQQLAEHGKSLAEQAVNAKTLGIGGTLTRKLLKGRAERALAREHLAPGAGITWQPSGATP